MRWNLGEGLRKFLDGRKCLTVWLNWWLQDWTLVQVNHTNNGRHGWFHDLAVHKSFRKTLFSPSPLSFLLSLSSFFSVSGFLCAAGGNKVWRKRKSTEMNKGGVFTRRRQGSNPILLPIWPRPLMETRNGETDICWMEKKTRGYFKCTKLNIGFKQWITGALW